MEQNKELTYVWIENRTWKSKFFLVFWHFLFSIPFFIFLLLYITNKNMNGDRLIFLFVIQCLLLLIFWDIARKMIETIKVINENLIINYSFKRSKIINISELESISAIRRRGNFSFCFITKIEIIVVEFFDMDSMFAYYLQSQGIKVDGMHVKKYPLNKILTNVPEMFKKPVETKNEEKSLENEN